VLPVLGAAQLSPNRLRCEYLENPIGLDVAAPRFNWIVESSAQGERQSAYQIVVSSTAAGAAHGQGDLWDSGKIASGQTTQVVYAGKQLQSGQVAYWTVTTWNRSGESSKRSSVAHWQAGIMRPEDWRAQWIGLPVMPNKTARPATYVWKSFDIAKPIKRAYVYASAKGLYRMTLDGKRVGNDIFTPGWTDYRKRIQYETYDITGRLKRGPNLVGMALGDGWYCGHVGNTSGNDYGDRAMGLVQMEIEYLDGSHDTIVSDGTWNAARGAIEANDLLQGESYDARKEVKMDGPMAGEWLHPDAVALDAVPLVAQHDPTVQQVAEIKPKKISQPKPGVYVYDLAQNMVGWARLKVEGKSGDKVQLRFAEMLNPDGTIYTTNLRGAKATDTYTLAGGKPETYEPTFTFHGFRYVEVTGYPGTPGMDAITGVVLSSNNPVTGEFACSNELVNKLQHNIFWGQRGNYLSVPTDCPQRDERLGWMGDAQIFARTACFNNDVAAFLTKWTQDVVDAQSSEGGFSDVSPRMGDDSDGAPAWGDAGVIVPWTVYQCYGDTRLLDERYPAMRKWIEYIDSVNPDHIWVKRSNNNFGDWLNVQDDTPRPVLATAYFAHSTDLLARSARVLGKTEDAEKYEALRDAIRAAFIQHFVDAEGKIQGDSQTCYVIALAFDLLPKDRRANVADRLAKHIAERKDHLSTGFVGVGYLNPTLTAFGKSDLAYKLLTNDTYPSWGYSIRQGATTIWERWDGWTDTKGFQDPGMNSFNHYSLGSVGEWMYKSVAGIDLDPAKPGYEHIIIHPVPGGGLTWARASLDSIHGRISSSWRVSGGEFGLDVAVPANTTATVYLPDGSVREVESGKFHFVSPIGR